MTPLDPQDASSLAPAQAPAAAPAAPDALDELLGGYEGLTAEAAERERATQRETARAAAALPAETAQSRRERAAAPAPDDDRWGLWLLWWLPSLLVPPFGGVVAWYALRFTHRRAALAMFSAGIAVGLVGAFLLARFATPIAAWVVGTSRDTVITLPSKTAAP